jgi:uncharacterized paraquat-inducible protein A
MVKNPQSVRRCPKCDTQIEKNGGCDHMHCSRCHSDFLWSRAPQAVRRPNQPMKKNNKWQLNEDLF